MSSDELSAVLRRYSDDLAGVAVDVGGRELLDFERALERLDLAICRRVAGLPDVDQVPAAGG